MTREQKLALILGFAIVLIVGVLVSDHLSGAHRSGDGVAHRDLIAEPDAALALGRPGTTTTADPRLMPGADGIVSRAQQQQLDPGLHTPELSPTRNARPLDQIAAAPNRNTGRTLLEQGVRAINDQIDQFNANPPGAALQTRTIVMGEPPVAELRRRAPDNGSTVGSGDGRVPVRTHTVRSGESLWSIAQQYYSDGSLHRKLAGFNADRVAESGDIRIGQTLLIPAKNDLDADPDRGWVRVEQSRARSTPQDPPRAQPRTYIVESGDTLSEIAQAQLGSAKRWRDILEANADTLDGPGDLWVGMTLTLPPRD
jgi:nucleoid-associated protein YgaU